MLKLFLIIYSANGVVSGVVGPLNPMTYSDCREEAARMTMRTIDRPPLTTFECEFHTTRPKINERFKVTLR